MKTLNRLIMTCAGSAVLACAQTTPIPINGVTGLPNQLNVRPQEGAAFTPGRTAVIDGTGSIEGAAGTLTDCMHVDGSSGPCSPQYVDSEVPSGQTDGSNTVFTLAQLPTPSTSLLLYRNGLLMTAGVDYNLANQQIRFVAGAVPQVGDILQAFYRTTNTVTSRSVTSAGATSLNSVSASARGFTQRLLRQVAVEDLGAEPSMRVANDGHLTPVGSPMAASTSIALNGEQVELPTYNSADGKVYPEGTIYEGDPRGPFSAHSTTSLMGKQTVWLKLPGGGEERPSVRSLIQRLRAKAKGAGSSEKSAESYLQGVTGDGSESNVDRLLAGLQRETANPPEPPSEHSSPNSIQLLRRLIKNKQDAVPPESVTIRVPQATGPSDVPLESLRRLNQVLGGAQQ